MDVLKPILPSLAILQKLKKAKKRESHIQKIETRKCFLLEAYVYRVYYIKKRLKKQKRCLIIPIPNENYNTLEKLGTCKNNFFFFW